MASLGGVGVRESLEDGGAVVGVLAAEVVEEEVEKRVQPK